MKKEVLFAIMLGLLLGLVVTYGIYRARLTLTRSRTTVLPSPTAGSSVTPPAPGDLSLTSPDDETLQFAKELKVVGTTKPNAHIVVFQNMQPYVTQADDSGSFTVSITLVAGSNILTVRSLDEDGKMSEVQRTVVYSTTPLEDDTASSSPSASPKASATPKASPKTSPTVSPQPKKVVKPSPSP